MYHPTDRIAHTMAFVTLVVDHRREREIAQCINPMKDRSDDPSHHERTLLPQSYISLPLIINRVVVLIVVVVTPFLSDCHLIQINNVFICFCSFDVSCRILEKDNLIKNVYIVLSCLIK